MIRQIKNNNNNHNNDSQIEVGVVVRLESLNQEVMGSNLANGKNSSRLILVVAVKKNNNDKSISKKSTNL